MKHHIVIISPALANANNGNWQTASRWAEMLQQDYDVSVVSVDTLNFASRPDLIIALHARRSAPALSIMREKYPNMPSILVLTGTDLYRDIHQSQEAQHALAQATKLVVLQPLALKELDSTLRHKAHVIYQSAPFLKPIGPNCKNRMRHFNVCMIGHLREEKDPATFMQAATHIVSPRIRLLHIGGALDADLGLQAIQTQSTYTNYHWLGELPHDEARHRLQRCHLMVIASKMEGGANVIIEAITSGVPVLASDISGNRGMLGDDYVGYFPVGDAAALAKMIERAANDKSFYQTLQLQCDTRAPLFSPEQEQAALLRLVDNTLHPQDTRQEIK